MKTKSGLCERLTRLIACFFLLTVVVLYLAPLLQRTAGAQFNATTGRNWVREQTITFSATPTFDLSTGTAFTMTLTGNVTSSTFSNGVAAATYTFRICQDGAGLHSFAWPASVKTTGLITIPGSALASTCAMQQLYWDGAVFRSVALGILNQ